MLAVFERDYYLRTSDFDCRGRLKPSSVLEIFQDAAGEHAGLLGCGYKQLGPRGLMWVVLRTKYQILGDCAMFDTVRVRTWPSVPSRVGYRRQYVISHQDGRDIAKGSSEWALIDAHSRRLVTDVKAYPEDTEFCEELCFPGRLERLRPFDDGEERLVIRPGYTKLDINGHVNNTAYADFALDAAEPLLSGPVESLQIDFRHELKYGSTVSISSKADENGLLLCGKDEKGEASFVCRMLQQP